jgi:hypothetical protein
MAGGLSNDVYVIERGSGNDTIHDHFEQTWIYYSKTGYVAQDTNGVWHNENGEEVTPEGTIGETDILWTYYQGTREYSLA